MWNAPLDVHGIHPGARPVRIGRKVHECASIEHHWISHAGVVDGYPFEPRAGRLNSPEIPVVVGRYAPNEVDESIIGRPHREVAMHPCWRDINPSVLGATNASRFPHEQRIAGCGGVVDESAAIMGPIELGGPLQIRPERTAGCRHGQDIHVAGLRAIRPPCPH